MTRLLLATLFTCLALVAPAGRAAEALFAGGCFWCMEADFEKLEGVGEVVSGFTGGTLPNPTYRGNHEGHYEAVKVNYDPAVVAYEELLEHFWRNIDPFDALAVSSATRGPAIVRRSSPPTRSDRPPRHH